MNGLVILGILVALFGNSAVIVDLATIGKHNRPTMTMVFVWAMGLLLATLAYGRIPSPLSP